MKKDLPILPFSSEDFNWCVKNDFQVYATHDSEGNLKVAIRRGGITTDGKDYLIVNGLKKTSKEMIGEIIYKDMNQLSLYLPAIYQQIKKQYG